MNIPALMLLILFGSSQDGERPGRFIDAPSFTLHLGGERFDPVQRMSRQADHRGKDLFLIQLNGPTRVAWQRDLERDGWEVVRYLHPFTYVVWGEPSGIARSAARSFVRWSGWFEPEFRLLPPLRHGSTEAMAVNMLAYEGADLSGIRDHLQLLGVNDISELTLDHSFRLFRFTLPASRFMDAVRVPGVYTLQPVPRDGGTRSELSSQLVAGNVDQGGLALPGYQTWLSGLDGGLGLDGTGVIMAAVDQGTQLDHDDLVARIAPCVGLSCTWPSDSNHGTHVAGIMAGDAASGAMDFEGFFRGLGVAPGANLVAQYFVSIYQEPGGMLTLMTESVRNGAVISSNSWGPSGTALGYDLDTMIVDMGVRDADPDLAGNQPLTYVLAIDNGFGGSKTQGTPDEGKNIFPVGSTYARFDTGAQRPNTFDLSNNSAHGPAQDGRFLPLIVAPGKAVQSTVRNNIHGFLSGTSMAAPRVAGTAGLFFEYFRRNQGADPSPALIKAAFLPVGQDLEGNRDADGFPLQHRVDAKQGWGRLDMAALLDSDVPVLYFDMPKLLMGTGDYWLRHFQVADETKPLKMMLAWTDAPGSGLGGDTPAWVNDLDLSVAYSGNTYAGNVFGAGGWSTLGGVHDFMNNTEGVMFGPTATGPFTVTVAGTNIPGDGVPQVGGPLDQDFAFVCYNCELAADFTLSTTETVLQVCAESPLVTNLDLGALAGFADMVTLSVMAPPEFDAQLDQLMVSPPDAAQLTLTPQPGALPGSYSVEVEASAGGVTKILRFAIELLTLDALPAASAPGNGLTGSALDPDFSWSAASGADTGYRFQLAGDTQFANLIVDTMTGETAYSLPFPLEPGNTFYWRVAAVNPCGETDFSEARSFTTVDANWRLLLVDDDDNSPDYRDQFTQTLDLLGHDYDLWDTISSTSEPLLADLEPYAVVIWFSGTAGGGLDPLSGPLPDTESELISYLEGGGNLFLFAREYVKDRGGVTALLTDYLGVASVNEDVSQTSVSGAGSLAGLGMFLLDHGEETNLSDAVNAGGDGELLLAGDQGTAMVGKRTVPYRAGFGAFMPGVMVGSERAAFVEALLDWAGLPVGCYAGGDVDGKAAQWPLLVTVQDLVTCLDQVSPPPSE